MNKNKVELLDKAQDKVPSNVLLKGIYIIQQKKLHESGYRQMYVIGHTEYKKEIEDFEYYLIGTYSDVVNFGDFYNTFHNLNLDINKHGIIHIWSDKDTFSPRYIGISTAWFDVR